MRSRPPAPAAPAPTPLRGELGAVELAECTREVDKDGAKSSMLDVWETMECCRSTWPSWCDIAGPLVLPSSLPPPPLPLPSSPPPPLLTLLTALLLAVVEIVRAGWLGGNAVGPGGGSDKEGSELRLCCL